MCSWPILAKIWLKRWQGTKAFFYFLRTKNTHFDYGRLKFYIYNMWRMSDAIFPTSPNVLHMSLSPPYILCPFSFVLNSLVYLSFSFLFFCSVPICILSIWLSDQVVSSFYILGSYNAKRGSVDISVYIHCNYFLYKHHIHAYKHHIHACFAGHNAEKEGENEEHWGGEVIRISAN